MALEDSSSQETGHTEPDKLYFIETFLRQRGDFQNLLAVDALVLRDDISAAEKAGMLQTIIQGALNGRR